MQLYLGYFEDFKGGDTLLLAGDCSAVEQLAEAVRAFGSGGESPLSLSGLVHPAKDEQLWLAQEPAEGAAGFCWLVRPAESAAVAEALRQVASGAPAHQYFELVGSRIQLLVSAGEYPPEWWRAQA